MKTMKLFVIIWLFIFTSCVKSKQIINTKDLSISLDKMSCSSYEVKNFENPIGYLIEPFILEVKNTNSVIISFEKLLKSSFYNRYNSYLRIYLFTTNSTSDTILNVVCLCWCIAKFIATIAAAAWFSTCGV